MAQRIKVKVDIDMSGIERELSSLQEDRALMIALHQLLAKKCDPYVPFDTGTLSQSLILTSEYVEYVAPYAHYQYHGVDFNHKLIHHPLATAFWDEAMLSDKRDEFEEECKQRILRRLRNNG